MKAKIFYLIATIAVVFFSCDKASELTEFNMTQNVDFVIPATPIAMNVDSVLPEISLNIDSILKSHSSSTDLITSIKVDKITLTISSPTSSDFDYLKSFSVYLATDKMAETKMAWAENLTPNQAKTLTLSFTDANLKEYFNASKFKIRIAGETMSPIAQDQEIKMTISAIVNANILGL